MKKKESSFAKDLENEGRDQVYMDVDRMINEGMARGNVFRNESIPNIEESRDLSVEDPPNK